MIFNMPGVSLSNDLIQKIQTEVSQPIPTSPTLIHRILRALGLR